MNNNPNRWDEYFYNICKAVSLNSTCLSRQIGSVLVKDKTIISSGYNGSPRGIPHCNERYIIDSGIRSLIKFKGKDPDDEKYHNTCPRQVANFNSGEGLEWCIAGHSETNTIINAARNGIITKGAKLYMSCGFPCYNCIILIINSGIEEIIITKKLFYDKTTEYLIKNSNLKVRVFKHLKNLEHGGKY